MIGRIYQALLIVGLLTFMNEAIYCNPRVNSKNQIFVSTDENIIKVLQGFFIKEKQIGYSEVKVPIFATDNLKSTLYIRYLQKYAEDFKLVSTVYQEDFSNGKKYQTFQEGKPGIKKFYSDGVKIKNSKLLSINEEGNKLAQVMEKNIALLRKRINIESVGTKQSYLELVYQENSPTDFHLLIITYVGNFLNGSKIQISSVFNSGIRRIYETLTTPSTSTTTTTSTTSTTTTTPLTTITTIAATIAPLETILPVFFDDASITKGSSTDKPNQASTSRIVINYVTNEKNITVISNITYIIVLADKTESKVVFIPQKEASPMPSMKMQQDVKNQNDSTLWRYMLVNDSFFSNSSELLLYYKISNNGSIEEIIFVHRITNNDGSILSTVYKSKSYDKKKGKFTSFIFKNPHHQKSTLYLSNKHEIIIPIDLNGPFSYIKEPDFGSNK